MSAEDGVSKKKQKKTERDAERQKKGKKRKRHEAEDHSPHAEDELQQDFIPLNGGISVTGSGADGAEKIASGVSKAHNDDASEQKPSKAKKRKKAKHNVTQPSEEHAEAVTSSDGKKHRFILFIGNLPYSATDASLHEHFKSLTPFTLRHRTDPKTKKSKGFAFLEFENYDRMKTCMKLYHHSIFDTAKAGANAGGGTDSKQRKEKGGRRINVELTAGGGGSKAEGRREKIKAKNVRLDEQRKRRLEEEWKEREKERAKKKSSGGDGGDGTDAPPTSQAQHIEAEDDTAAMHPSRAARMTK